MEVVYPQCAGLDVHKKSVVACAITPNCEGGWQSSIRSFSTMTCGLLQLLDWLIVKCQLPCQVGDNYLSSRDIGSVPWLSDNYAARD
jgi:hypothetical protein